MEIKAEREIDTDIAHARKTGQIGENSIAKVSYNVPKSTKITYTPGPTYYYRVR